MSPSTRSLQAATAGVLRLVACAAEQAQGCGPLETAWGPYPQLVDTDRDSQGRRHRTVWYPVGALLVPCLVPLHCLVP